MARHVVIDAVRAHRPPVALEPPGELIAGGRSPGELAVAGDELRALTATLDTLMTE